MRIRRTGYVAACYSGGEYVQLGPFRRKRQAIDVGATSLPIFEVLYVDGIKGNQRVIHPLLYGYAKPQEITI